jgi:hypothetical protein
MLCNRVIYIYVPTQHVTPPHPACICRYLVRALAVWPVHWPRTLGAVAACFGGGGGGDSGGGGGPHRAKPRRTAAAATVDVSLVDYGPVRRLCRRTGDQMGLGGGLGGGHLPACLTAALSRCWCCCWRCCVVLRAVARMRRV